MLNRKWRAAALAAALMGVGGCASVVSDDESTTYIGTNPENARCELHGQDFTRVVNTPASLHLPANSAPMTIACRAEGYFLTTEELDTEADGWILGNLLFGGIIGIAIDAASGAGQKFPPQISIVLQPSEFTSEQARDEWFAARRTAINNTWDSAVEALEKQCNENNRTRPENCPQLMEKALSSRQRELAELEINYPKSQIVPERSVVATREASSGSLVRTMDSDVLDVILSRNGYASQAEAHADYLTMDTDAAAKARFTSLPGVAKNAIIAELDPRFGNGDTESTGWGDADLREEDSRTAKALEPIIVEGRWEFRLEVVETKDKAYPGNTGFCSVGDHAERVVEIKNQKFSGSMSGIEATSFIRFSGSQTSDGTITVKAYAKRNKIDTTLSQRDGAFTGTFHAVNAYGTCIGVAELKKADPA